MAPGTTFPIVAISFFLLNGNQGPDQCVEPKNRPKAFLHSIGVVFDDERARPTVAKAVELWRHCENYGADFPPFLVGENGQRTIHVEVIRGRNGRRCGALIGNRITVYRRALAPSGLPMSCGPSERVLAHELGHALGLGDLQGGPECRSHVMSQTSPENEHSRSVRAAECGAVGALWLNGADRDPLASTRAPDPPRR